MESQRVAHGLFGLVDGVFRKVLIPQQQMGNPNVRQFLNDYFALLEMGPPNRGQQ